MEYRKRSRSNPIDDDSDDSVIDITKYEVEIPNSRVCCFRCIIWLYKKLTCQSHRIILKQKLPL